MISCKLCLEMMMGSVVFILEEKLNVIFLFLMNLNKKKRNVGFCQ